MLKDEVKKIYDTMKKLRVFTREELEYKLLSKNQDTRVAAYIDELLTSPVVKQVYNQYIFVG